MKENLIPLLTLIVISVVLLTVVIGFKKLFKYFVNEEWKQGKFGVPLAVVFGLLYGFTARIGIVTSFMLLMGITLELGKLFLFVDILACSMILSQGPYGLIQIATKSVDTLINMRKLKKRLNEELLIYRSDPVAKVPDIKFIDKS